MIAVKNATTEAEREVLNPKSVPPPEKKNKKLRVRFFDVIAECFKGNSYVEVEVEEDAFEEAPKEFSTLNIKKEDI